MYFKKFGILSSRKQFFENQFVEVLIEGERLGVDVKSRRVIGEPSTKSVTVKMKNMNGCWVFSGWERGLEYAVGEDGGCVLLEKCFSWLMDIYHNSASGNKLKRETF